MTDLEELVRELRAQISELQQRLARFEDTPPKVEQATQAPGETR